MKLSALIEGLEITADNVPRRLDVVSIVCDSRQTRPGDVFVAIPGAKQDGRVYAEDARKRGAAIMVCEPPAPNVDLPVLLVPKARIALAQLACRIFHEPSRQLSVFGVTGTNGKTTTAALITAALRAAGNRVGLLSTVQIEIANRIIPAVRTTPDAPTLQRLLAEMVAHQCQSAVLEISSHALDQHRADGTRLDCALFTNLTRDHLDYHGSMEAYFAAKRRLFDLLAANPKGIAVVNQDDPWGRRLLGELQTRSIETRRFGIEAGDARTENLRLDRDGAHFDMVLPGGRLPMRSRLPGRYNVANLLGAALAAQAGGAPLETIGAALRAFKPRWGRLERIDSGRTDAPAVFVDYAHTDDALANVLQTVREITRGRLILVFGCGGDRDPGKRPAMSRVAARWADCLIITSDNPRSEDPLSIIDAMLPGLQPDSDYRICVDRRKAIETALECAENGDSVVIAGKGHETYQELAHTVVPFDDREIAREWLRTHEDSA